MKKIKVTFTSTFEFETENDDVSMNSINESIDNVPEGQMWADIINNVTCTGLEIVK
jgi:hypothetical protein